jgi:cytochrome bd-type quinol oxidase subunit 1
MEFLTEIFKVAQVISPIGVIFLLVVIVYKLILGDKTIFKISKTQDEKYPKLEQGISLTEQVAGQLALLVSGQEKIMGNHLHELPEMTERIRKIDEKQDKMIEILTEIKINTRK